MAVFLIKALQLILAFAILVIIHEFGHFLFARLFGIRVERFYIFFNPKFSLFKWKPKEYAKCLSKNTPFESESQPENNKEEASDSKETTEIKELAKTDEQSEVDKTPKKNKKKKKGFWNDTEYGIGWLPLGGYCKISGMIDESMDKEQMAKPAQPWEFRSKPAWQRLLVMIAGVLFNFLLAILIYAGIVYATGEEYVPLKEAKAGMHFSPEAQKIGFKDGDIPLYADGKEINPLKARLEIMEAEKVDVLRGNDTVTIAIPENFIFRIDDEAKKMEEQGEPPIIVMDYRMPVKITQVVPGEGGAKAGIKNDDIIIAVDSVPTPYIEIFREELKKHPGATVDITLLRATSAGTDTLSLPVKLSETGKMGVQMEIDPSVFYNAEIKEYGLLASVPRGVQLGTEQLTSYVKQMRHVFTKEGSQKVGGFGAIGSIFPEKWDWIAFWNVAAFLSVALAFMNILPIPALDGGHVLFLLYEVIFRRPPNQKFMEWAQMIGMGLLILLLLYANGLDIIRLFK